MTRFRTTPIAIVLHQTGGSSEAETLAIKLSGARPRDLLRNVLPASDARLYRLLDRATLPAWSHADYLALDAVLRSDVADMLLRRDRIEPSYVRDAHAILKSSPILMRACHAVANQYERERLETVAMMLDLLGLTRTLAASPTGPGARQ